LEDVGKTTLLTKNLDKVLRPTISLPLPHLNWSRPLMPPISCLVMSFTDNKDRMFPVCQSITLYLDEPIICSIIVMTFCKCIKIFRCLQSTYIFIINKYTLTSNTKWTPLLNINNVKKMIDPMLVYTIFCN